MGAVCVFPILLWIPFKSATKNNHKSIMATSAMPVRVMTPQTIAKADLALCHCLSQCSRTMHCWEGIYLLTLDYWNTVNAYTCTHMCSHILQPSTSSRITGTERKKNSFLLRTSHCVSETGFSTGQRNKKANTHQQQKWCRRVNKA